jgi:hypothetical protein
MKTSYNKYRTIRSTPLKHCGFFALSGDFSGNFFDGSAIKERDIKEF